MTFWQKSAKIILMRVLPKLLVFLIVPFFLIPVGIIILLGLITHRVDRSSSLNPTLSPTSSVVFLTQKHTQKPSFSPTSTPFLEITDELINEKIKTYLPSHLITTTSDNGRVFCAHHLYGWKKDSKKGLIFAYIWAYCQEYYLDQKGKLEQGAGVSEPLKITLKIQNGVLEAQFHQEPQNGSLYVPSIKEMFPSEYATQAINNQPSSSPLKEEVESQARKWFLHRDSTAG